MEAAMVEMSASEPRERLLAVVGQVVRPPPEDVPSVVELRGGGPGMTVRR